MVQTYFRHDDDDAADADADDDEKPDASTTRRQDIAHEDSDNGNKAEGHESRKEKMPTATKHPRVPKACMTNHMNIREQIWH